MSRIGYARVSTPEQSLDAQIRQLEDAGCDRIYSETASGVRARRPQFEAMVDYLRDGDTVVVVRLDRLGRSVRQLVELLERFEAMGVQFCSLSEGMDTSTPIGRMVFQISAAFAEMEREIIRERTIAGLEAARAKGRKGGRPKADLDAVARAESAISSGMSVREACSLVGISKSTYYRYRSAGNEG